MSGHPPDEVAWCWGSEPPAHSIGYEPKLFANDSGLCVLFADAPDPGES